MSSELTQIVESDLEDSPQGAVFSAEKFEKFCGKLLVDTKEKGRIPLTLLGTQRYLIRKIEEGLSSGIHTFVVLKGRQLGISTLMLALDLYWMLKYPGLQGAVVTDTDDNEELFRANISLLVESLPSRARKKVKRHNRVQLILDNNSRLVYMSAGTKKNGGLGRAKSANYAHMTECSSWGDEEGFASLVNTLAQQNPHRLYVLESTARGFDMFYQICETAQESTTQEFIFVGWWLNELYSWPQDSVEYQTFWTGDLVEDEKVWVREVYEKYGHEITDMQIAWWRWYVKDRMQDDEQMALQEMPPTEDYAFQLSGSKYFSSQRINQQHGVAKDLEAVYFRYTFGTEFEHTEFHPCTEEEVKHKLYDVMIWETPVRAVAGGMPGKYTCGADPAYGSSEWADWHVGSIFRCFSDRIIQTAEFGNPDWTDIQFAWVLAHMCGWYGDIMLNLEMQGPGTAVFNELMNLRNRAGLMPSGDPRAEAFDVIGRVRDYLWKKQDSMYGNFAYQWQTTGKEKVRLMSTFKSNWERGVITLKSARCIQQMRNVHRTGDKIGGEGRAKDDHVMAAAIGHIAWNDSIQLELIAAGRSYAMEMRPKQELVPFTPLQRSIVRYLQDHKLKVPGLTP